MSIVQRDFILRAIEQLGKAVARIMNLVAERKYEEALAAVDQAEEELLGEQLRTLEGLDGTSAALFLHQPERARGWALLLAQRAQVFALVDRPADARNTARRALALYAAAERRGAQLGELDQAARLRLQAL